MSLVVNFCACCKSIFLFYILHIKYFIFYILLSSFPSTTYWRGCLFLITCFFLIYYRLIDHRCMDLFLGFLSCSTDLYVCFCPSTIQFWWLQICSIDWSQGAWFFQLSFSFSRWLWLFRVYLCSIHVGGMNMWCDKEWKEKTGAIEWL